MGRDCTNGVNFAITLAKVGLEKRLGTTKRDGTTDDNTGIITALTMVLTDRC